MVLISAFAGFFVFNLCVIYGGCFYLDSVYLDLYLLLDSMVLISAFAGFNLCWFVMYFPVGCCASTCGFAGAVAALPQLKFCGRMTRALFAENGIIELLLYSIA